MKCEWEFIFGVYELKGLKLKGIESYYLLGVGGIKFLSFLFFFFWIVDFIWRMLLVNDFFMFLGGL